MKGVGRREIVGAKCVAAECANNTSLDSVGWLLIDGSSTSQPSHPSWVPISPLLTASAPHPHKKRYNERQVSETKA